MTSAFQLKTRIELAESQTADYRNSIDGVRAEGAGDDFYDIAQADSGALSEGYGALARSLDEAFPQTSSFETLVLHARRFIGTPKAATKAAGTAIATGDDDAPWSEGATLVHRASQQRYRAKAAGQIVDGEGLVQIEALAGGADGWLAPNEELVWESPPAGINPVLAIAAMTGGTAAEKREEYLNRLLERLLNPEAGGTDVDHATWVLGREGVGVSAAFPNRRDLGTCDVAALDFEGDPVSAEVLADAQEDLDARRPCTSRGSMVVNPSVVDIDPVYRVVLDSPYEFSTFDPVTVLADSTASRILLSDVSGLSVGDWVAIPRLRAARQITQVDLPGGAVFVAPAFAAAPEAGWAAIAGCPTYDALAASVADYGRTVKPGSPFYKDGAEGALGGNPEVVSKRQLDPTDDVVPVVTEVVIEAVRVRSVTLVSA
ncbi:MAG: baseplate J/gp47 family protein [Deltaproteobacteria bacterium]|nr:baseplate J/gp47 family protein [Deltaproteobacteria bacterium]